MHDDEDDEFVVIDKRLEGERCVWTGGCSVQCSCRPL